MSARAFTNSQKNPQSSGKPAVVQTATVSVKTPVINDTKLNEANLSVAAQQEFSKSIKSIVTHEDRAKFYTGHERLNLQSIHVKRVRELQEENDNLQREISFKEKEIVECKDPLSILADIEHRKIMVARNTGEIMKIYAKNEDRVRRITELEALNNKLQKDLIDAQGKFITATEMDDRTKCASDFFIVKSAIEHNIKEIDDLSRN